MRNAGTQELCVTISSVLAFLRRTEPRMRRGFRETSTTSVTSYRWVVFFVLSVLVLASVGRAYDLWVIPGKFVLSPGERTRIFINSGDEFPQSASLVGEHRIESFSLVTSRGRKPLNGLVADGKSLTVELTAPDAGTAVLALATKSRLVRLKADEFNAYLKEDGLPQILALREERDEMTQPVVERYTKWAKAILRVGEEIDETWSQPVGHRIEIVPESDWQEMGAGETVVFRVLFEGEPLAGVTVTGTRAGGARNELQALTDEDGRARMSLTKAGRWYLHTIHMVRLKDDPHVQWESFWATLTFEVQN
jgi:uncharacterized GH25 family protein